MDPLLTSQGELYGPKRVNDIIRECYIISKNCHTSYTDVLDITPMERETLLNIIGDELANQKKAIDKIKAKNKHNNRKGAR